MFSTVKDAKPVSQRFHDVWPYIREMARSRRGIFALGFVLMIINRVSGLVLPASSKFLLDNVLTQHQYGLLTPLVLAVAGATLVQGVTTFLLTQVVSKAAQRLIAELREKVQRHIGRLPISYFDGTKTGTLVSRIMTDVESIRNLLGTGSIEFLGGLLTAIFAFVLLLRISPLMTGIAMSVVVVFCLILQQAFKRIRPIFRQRGEINAAVTGRLNESLGGIRVVKGYHAEEREAEIFAAGSQRLLQIILRSITATSLMSMCAAVLMGIVGAAIMYVGSRQIAAGALTLGGFSAFTMLLAFMIMPVVQMVSIGTQLTEALAGLDRTYEVLRQPPEDSDPRRTLAMPLVEGNIRFDGVSFAYENGKDVLHNISFEAKPGTVTALVGPSGSGKSTITGLIAAFYAPNEGTIRVDGIDLATVRLDSYRMQLGVVLQDTFLFDGTIRENVLFARPGASSGEFLRACRIAKVDEFAEGFELGYETIVGERGVKLSGGQKQRVSIARAILADPRILILDEATSSLDSESEAFIQAGLEYLMQSRTTFVIAHRLSTIQRAQQILVVEDGRIAERGSHGSLYAARGRYYDLYTRQHGLEENLFLAPGEGDALAETEEEKQLVNTANYGSIIKF